MLALLSGLGIKDIFYGLLITVALSWGGWTYHKYETAVTYARDAKAETAQVQAAAQANIDTITARHAANLAAIQERYHASLQAAQSTSATLAGKLRNYTSHSCPGSVLPSAGTPASGTTAGAGGAGSVEQSLEQLISAAAHDNAVIAAERAERDSLTGK
jgi:hypothetical protein